MILSADQILDYVTTNNKGKSAQVGYDLTVKDIKTINGGTLHKDKTELEEYSDVIKTNNDDYFILSPGAYSLTFEQGIKLDNKHTAIIRHRSSILRMGAIITSGVYDPGFEVDEMGAVLINSKPISIQKGARVAQVIISENHSAELYDGQWQGSKDVK
jgi:dUTP pyrophosphatase